MAEDNKSNEMASKPGRKPGNHSAKYIQMFKDWILGATYGEIAKKYDVKYSLVYYLSKRYKWNAMRAELRARQYARALDDVKDIVINAQRIIKTDLGKIDEDINITGRMLTHEERQHIRSLLDRMLKEARLEDGKPTDITDNINPQVQIILPEGAKRFGLIPPDQSVIVSEKPKVSRMGNHKRIDLDAIDAELIEKEKQLIGDDTSRDD